VKISLPATEVETTGSCERAENQKLNWAKTFSKIRIKKREAQSSSGEKFEIQGYKIFVFNQFETKIKAGEEIEKHNISIRSI
jgi:hypothetical protein